MTIRNLAPGIALSVLLTGTVHATGSDEEQLSVLERAEAIAIFPSVTGHSPGSADALKAALIRYTR